MRVKSRQLDFGEFRPNSVLPKLSLALVLVVLGILCFEGLQTKYVSPAFSYSADIVSTDSAYDPVSQRYAGARYSRGIFSMQLAGQSSVESKLVSTDINEQPIATIRRVYAVDTASGKVQQDAADSYAAGYLFAPRNLRKGQKFTYRHVTYNAPAHMQYAGQEELFGLDVYRYETHYKDIKQPIVQDAVANNGLPAGQGERYKPYLQIWVEPATGWLVKYQEDTTLELYNKATGKTVRPADHFFASTTEETVRQHVAYARTQKYVQTLLQRVVPSVFVVIVFCIALAVVLRRLGQSPLSVYGAAGTVFVVSVAALVGWALGSQPLVTAFSGVTSLSAINPLSCVCFIIVSVCLVLLYRKVYANLAIFLAGLLVILSGLALLGGINAIPLRADLLLFKNSVLDLSVNVPSRMPLFAALAFLLLGIGLARVALSRARTAVRFAKFIAGLVAAVGVLGVIVELFRLDVAFTLSFFYSHNLVTALLFIGSGLAYLRILLQIEGGLYDIKTLLRTWVVPALAVIPLAVIAAFAQLQQNAVKQKLQANFSEQTVVIQSSIDANMQSYQNFFSGARALFAASNNVERQEWSAYTKVSDIKNNYPGLLYAGYAKTVANKELAGYQADVRSQGLPKFSVFPQSSLPEHTVLSYVEPLTDNTAKYLGYDLSTNNVLVQAMERTTNSGAVTVSDKRQDDAGIPDKSLPRFSLLAPIYAGDSLPETAALRQKALRGFIVGSVNASLFMDKALYSIAPKIDVEVYDGLSANSDSLLYDRYGDSAFDGHLPRLAKSAVVYVGNHPWTVWYKALPEFRLSKIEEHLPTFSLLGCSLMYLIVLTSAYTELSPRLLRYQDKSAKPGRDHKKTRR